MKSEIPIETQADLDLQTAASKLVDSLNDMVIAATPTSTRFSIAPIEIVDFGNIGFIERVDILGKNFALNFGSMDDSMMSNASMTNLITSSGSLGNTKENGLLQ